MSELGWRAFLAGGGVEEWVILHGGPTAVFKVTSLQRSAQLAAAIAELPGLEPRTLLTVAADRLTIKLTREMLGTEERHIEVACEISRLASEHGAVADTGAVQEVQLAIAAKPEEIDLGFWRAVQGYTPLHEDDCLDPNGQGSTVWIQELDPARPLRHAMHVDVSVGRTEAEARMTARSPREGGSSTIQRRPARGSSGIGPATRCASRHGQMACSQLIPSRLRRTPSSVRTRFRGRLSTPLQSDDREQSAVAAGQGSACNDGRRVALLRSRHGLPVLLLCHERKRWRQVAE